MRRLLRLNDVARQQKPPEKSMDVEMDTHKHTIRELEDVAGKSEVRGDDWKVALQRSVKRLHFGSWEEKDAAAKEIIELAGDDLKRRQIMAELGVIPPLVAMVGSEVVARQRLAVRALIVLANGSFTNRALMLEAGILSKLPENIGISEETARQEIAQLLLSISAMAKFPTKIIPIIISILESNPNTIETQESCLTTLHNLSSVLDNIRTLADTNVVNTLIRLSSSKKVSEKSLAILANLVVTLAGRKALEHNTMIPEGIIEIMTWEEKPKCQELSAYILMVLAHQSSLQRLKMAKAGIVQVLLELVLLGTPLAQKRALRILQWFKDERQVKIGPHSRPLMRVVSVGSPVGQRSTDEGEKLMKKIVRQSLYKNLETITRRANYGDGDSSNSKALVISSSSKSLPY
ncbi:hypothetical protein DH2020_009016 [Rehmannia glutinosa]|uniref:U-box domain-containing protein n=1 Tax=Rehmannia glutinosa TaxID=99300 RepID=A0ABR0X535_REHGL